MINKGEIDKLDVIKLKNSAKPIVKRIKKNKDRQQEDICKSNLQQGTAIKNI